MFASTILTKETTVVQSSSLSNASNSTPQNDVDFSPSIQLELSSLALSPQEGSRSASSVLRVRKRKSRWDQEPSSSDLPQPSPCKRSKTDDSPSLEASSSSSDFTPVSSPDSPEEKSSTLQQLPIFPTVSDLVTKLKNDSKTSFYVAPITVIPEKGFNKYIASKETFSKEFFHGRLKAIRELAEFINTVIEEIQKKSQGIEVHRLAISYSLVLMGEIAASILDHIQRVKDSSAALLIVQEAINNKAINKESRMFVPLDLKALLTNLRGSRNLLADQFHRLTPEQCALENSLGDDMELLSQVLDTQQDFRLFSHSFSSFSEFAKSISTIKKQKSLDRPALIQDALTKADMVFSGEEKSQKIKVYAASMRYVIAGTCARELFDSAGNSLTDDNLERLKQLRNGFAHAFFKPDFTAEALQNIRKQVEFDGCTAKINKRLLA